ncbi:alpha/beta hydrolase [Aliiroseovarius sp. M344]|nr:alpha/beta hydrolase [Aliiroseovarius sp. M344]
MDVVMARSEKRCAKDLKYWVIQLAAVIFCSFSATPSASIAQPTDMEEVVPFLTLRNDTGSDVPEESFGDERSNPKAGWCKVRELDLDLLSPLAEASPAYIREELLKVDWVQKARRDAVFDALEISAGGGMPLLYVHGYNISFEKGCRRASTLQKNAGLTGRLLWFSWPSDGALTNYTHDEADLYWSIPDLADAIEEMEGRFGGNRTSIAGHSLGARGVVLALYEVASRNPDIRIDEVVLLAPDMDFQIFERILPRIRPIVGNITIYITSGDRPLALSAQLHGYPRLGETGNDVSNLSAVEIIDLSDLPAESPTGHLYHIYSEEVGADLSQLLNEGKPANKRRNLVRTGKNLWILHQDDGVADE